MTWTRWGVPLTAGLALGVALVAGLIGISVTHGDQEAHIGLFVLESPLGAILAAAAAASFTASLVASRARPLMALFLGVAVATAASAMVVLDALRSDVDAINSSMDGTAQASNMFATTFAGPIHRVDAGTTSSLIVATAALLLIAVVIGSAGIRSRRGHT